jgi:hypothetical protein
VCVYFCSKPFSHWFTVFPVSSRQKES